jgi:hypothetical protein
MTRDARGRRVVRRYVAASGRAAPPRPDDAIAGPAEREAARMVALTPISDLDLAIRNGWGDIPQTQLPPDWRTRRRIPRSAPAQTKEVGA